MSVSRLIRPAFSWGCLVLLTGCHPSTPSFKNWDSCIPPVSLLLVETPSFSYVLPGPLIKTSIRTGDPFIEHYEANGIKLIIMYGKDVEDFQGSPSETVYETVNIGDETVRIGTREVKDRPGVGFITQAYVAKTEHHSNLVMTARCHGKAEVDLVRIVYTTICF